RPLGNGDRLAKLRRRLQIIDAAADEAGRSEDGAILPPIPAIADADRLAVLELHLTVNGAGDGICHGCTLQKRDGLLVTYPNKPTGTTSPRSQQDARGTPAAGLPGRQASFQPTLPSCAGGSVPWRYPDAA